LAPERAIMTPSQNLLDPPRWLDAVVRRLIRRRDRDAISGDLLEEYREAIIAGDPPFTAASRLLSQALSVFLLLRRPRTTGALCLGILCTLSAAGVGWLSFRSPNPVVLPIAAVLAAQSLVTVAVLRATRRLPYFILQPGSVAAVMFGVLALIETVVWTDFEWKVAATGVALILQGMVTMALSAGLFGGLQSRSNVL
jgi:hypothetical protein